MRPEGMLGPRFDWRLVSDKPLCLGVHVVPWQNTKTVQQTADCSTVSAASRQQQMAVAAAEQKGAGKRRVSSETPLLARRQGSHRWGTSRRASAEPLVATAEHWCCAQHCHSQQPACLRPGSASGAMPRTSPDGQAAPGRRGRELVGREQ